MNVSNRNRILWVGVLTLLIFGGGGMLIIKWIQGLSVREVFLKGESVGAQLLIGLVIGLLSAGMAMWIITRNFFREERNYYFDLIGQMTLNLPGIIFLSLCAGIGEELFFRAGLQPFLGIWPTSFLFVLLHGYIRLRNWRMNVYGFMMVSVIAGFGYMFEKIGLISVMVAHTVFDCILFIQILRRKS